MNSNGQPVVIQPDELESIQLGYTQIHPENFPKAIISDEYPFWILWTPAPNNPSEPTKILKKPVNVKWAHKETGQTFSQALKTHQKLKDRRPVALGFKYTDEHPFVCIDLDELTEENAQLLTILDSYTEYSPSGSGLHVIVQVPSIGAKQFIINEFATGKRNKAAERDLFVSTGYVTVTGNLYSANGPDQIKMYRPEILVDILAPYFVRGPRLVKSTPEMRSDNSAIYNRIRKTQKKSLKPLNPTQVKALLSQVPVQQLASDVFDRLYNNEYCVLDPECVEEARQPWLIIGQAIHHNFEGNVNGYMLWSNWSERGNKFDSKVCEDVWNSFSQKESPVTIAALIKLVNAQQPQFVDVSIKGFHVGTINNFRIYADFFGFKFAFNEISKEYLAKIPKAKQKEWDINKYMSINNLRHIVHGDLEMLKLPKNTFSISKIENFMCLLCEKNIVNPVRNYFEKCGEKWDHHDYIADLFETIQVKHMKLKPTYLLFLRKWLIQVAAAACHSADNPVRLNRVLIFSGPQDTGKTEWVSSLFPQQLKRYCAPDKDLSLKAFRTDSAKQELELSNILMCNINEIDRFFSAGTFTAFKAYLDKTVDRLVLPYGRDATVMNRRTVFIGSTNKTNFLHDRTGNRRFEVMEILRLNFKHGIDLEQLWGQVYNLYAAGEKWWLDTQDTEEAKAIRMRDHINNDLMYVGSEAFIELIETIFDVDKAMQENKWTWLTFKQIRDVTGASHLAINSKAFNQAKHALAVWVEKISGEKPRKSDVSVRSILKYKMPPILGKEDIYD